ncbi:uncharacterized protein FTOL_00816 [Fusarium torulosum]|uniref:Uncharacterized protein n=1 Tax=Fusarium torulosum TaxID=33205 RepID=A0AAE8LZ45_9HYPO|nr:uncharacterized protein FTOL_00816 [Fusarium torulosum]
MPLDQSMEKLGTPIDEAFTVPNRILNRLSRVGLKWESFDDLYKATHPHVKITDQRRCDMWSEIFREWEPDSPAPLIPPVPTRSSKIKDSGFEAGVYITLAMVDV